MDIFETITLRVFKRLVINLFVFESSFFYTSSNDFEYFDLSLG